MPNQIQTVKAIFPGSFDPLTLGHAETARQAARIFGGLTLVVAQNLSKDEMLPFERRMELADKALRDVNGITVDSFSGLLADYVRQNGVDVIVKGVRGAMDFEYEVQMARLNRELAGVDTVFLPADPRYAHISSTMARQVAALGGNIHGLVPREIVAELESLFK